MEGLDYWRLCDELSVIQAALLIVGVDPAGCQEYVQEWEPKYRPDGFDAAFAALKNAVNRQTLKAQVRQVGYEHYPLCQDDELNFDNEVDGKKGVGFNHSPDWGETTIGLDDLRDWLSKRGLKPEFFFPQATDMPDYLDANHPNYAPKLAAAIFAWEKVTMNPDSMRGTTVKQTMMKWLRKHADHYGLTKEDGSLNEQGIEEVAKISNWDAKGGAPKTNG